MHIFFGIESINYSSQMRWRGCRSESDRWVLEWQTTRTCPSGFSFKFFSFSSNKIQYSMDVNTHQNEFTLPYFPSNSSRYAGANPVSILPRQSTSVQIPRLNSSDTNITPSGIFLFFFIFLWYKELIYWKTCHAVLSIMKLGERRGLRLNIDHLPQRTRILTTQVQHRRHPLRQEMVPHDNGYQIYCQNREL
jgi:hypothetical protein